MNALANRDAELAAIGIAMQDATSAAHLAALPADTFSDADTQAIHRAVQRIVSRRAMPDMITLAAECRTDLPDPETLLIQASSMGIGSSFFAQHAGILAECRQRRALMAMASEIIKAAPDASASLPALVDKSIKALQATDAEPASMDAQQALMAFIDSLDNAKKGRVTTGIAGLDRLTGGLRGGKLVVLGARPGVGKTALALSMAIHAARHAGPVLIVSLEMDAEEIMSRIVAAESGTDVQCLESGDLSDQDAQAVGRCYGEVSALPIRIATHASTPLQIRQEATSMQHRQGLAMVVVDYIQLMHGSGKSGTRYEEISAISRDLKLLAMDLGVPILALTQFNRQSEGGVGGKAERRAPSMAEAKDSGSIEQDANLFLIQYEPPEPKPVPGDPAWEAWNTCQRTDCAWQTLTIAKNRQGRTGVINMAFDKPRMRFRSIEYKG